MILNKLENGKYSETLIKNIKSYRICSLVECSLKTGRTHQVRVHMNSINFPLIGDKLYGKNKSSKYSKDKKNINNFLLLKNFDRHALHAHILGFEHPKSKKILKFKSNIPFDMLNLLEYIQNY
jgi:23S rRNA pseudouridine1911/1915/1917 synthase